MFLCLHVTFAGAYLSEDIRLVIYPFEFHNYHRSTIMLPPEAFAEAVAFHRLFDLDALLVANALCSSLALKASAAIRWEEFPGLRLYFANQWIYIDRTPEQDGEERRWTPVELLTFPRDDQMAEFVDAALPNCIFEELTLFDLTSKKVRDAIGRVADSIVIKGALRPPYHMSPDDSLELVRKFRKVKVSLSLYSLLQLQAF